MEIFRFSFKNVRKAKNETYMKLDLTVLRIFDLNIVKQSI